jgi:hypothetical protein
VGVASLSVNQASGLTAIGSYALSGNTTGTNNTALGFNALSFNTDGSQNTAVGDSALANHTQGNNNIAVGWNALLSDTTGDGNVAIGGNALVNNDTSFNTAIGAGALLSASTGNSNVAVGFEALANKTAGANNIALGTQAGNNLITGGGNIYIGNPGVDNDAGTIRIGNTHSATFVAGINGVDQGSPTAVFINTTTGRLGTTPPASSRRYKKEIKPMDSERSNPGIQAGHVPIQERYKRHAAIWFDRRRSSKGESCASAAR